MRERGPAGYLRISGPKAFNAATKEGRCPRVSYQTIKLSKGKHSIPEDGACVMELASMLAGEPFTDHPASVCPVIGSFLRSYNDSIDDARRQCLYEYASKVVGSRGSQRTQQARAERLAQWAERDAPHPADVVPVARRCARSAACAGRPPMRSAPMPCTRCAGTPTQTHAAVLSLIDELLAIGVRDDRVSARVIAARARALDPAA